MQTAVLRFTRANIMFFVNMRQKKKVSSRVHKCVKRVIVLKRVFAGETKVDWSYVKTDMFK